MQLAKLVETWNLLGPGDWMALKSQKPKDKKEIEQKPKKEKKERKERDIKPQETHKKQKKKGISRGKYYTIYDM